MFRNPLTGELSEVPGIGPAAIKHLAAGEESIENTYQLIGKFFMLKSNDDGEPINCVDHCDAFWQWLKSKGINSFRSGIVNAIAEKMNTMVPGIYEANEFPNEE